MIIISHFSFLLDQRFDDLDGCSLYKSGGFSFSIDWLSSGCWFSWLCYLRSINIIQNWVGCKSFGFLWSCINYSCLRSVNIVENWVSSEGLSFSWCDKSGSWLGSVNVIENWVSSEGFSFNWSCFNLSFLRSVYIIKNWVSCESFWCFSWSGTCVKWLGSVNIIKDWVFSLCNSFGVISSSFFG